MYFRGEYYFLSNFYPINIKYEEIIYPSTENAFQAAKCAFQKDKLIFTKINAAEARALGKKIKIRPDWEKTKEKNMAQIIDIKFNNIDLAARLKAVNNEIIEENTWHDNFWGNCVCPKCVNRVGKNSLGKILTEKRERLMRDDI